jgi:hypothetical protein
MIQRLRRLGLNFWLAAVAGAILILLIVQLVRYAWAGTLGEDIVKASQWERASPVRSNVKGPDEYKPLLEKGHFGKRKEGPPKPPALFGILGKVALLGNSPDDAKPYEVGAGLPDGSKLVEILLASVVIEKDGKKQTIVLFPELGTKAEPPAGPPQPQPSPDQKPAETPPAAGAAAQPGTPGVDKEKPPDQQETGPQMRTEPSREPEMRERRMRRERPS